MATTGLTDTIFAGNKRVQRFTVADDDTAGSPPKDLTGLVVKWALSTVDKYGTPSTAAILSKSSAVSGVTIVDATNGIVDVTIDPADTVSLTPTLYYFELEVFSGTDPVVVATGTLLVKPNVVNT